MTVHQILSSLPDKEGYVLKVSLEIKESQQLDIFGEDLQVSRYR